MWPQRLSASAACVVTLTTFIVPFANSADADDGCGAGTAPPPHSAGQDVGAVYGQPATLWLTNTTVGISTAQGYGEAPIVSASPLPRSALLVDAQQNGNHQIIVDTGRAATLYAVTGCTISPVVDERGAPFSFDIGQRRGLGDGVGCSDLGDGRHLVQLLQVRGPKLSVRRTEIELTGSTATIGRSDTVIATSQQDPVWTTATGISCGERTITRDGVFAPG